MQRYWDLTEKQRANLEEEQLQHLLAVELMEAGIVRPAPPVLEDETTPTVATRRFYGITTGNGRYGGREDIGILFESETAAAAFLRDTRPLISVSDYETGKTFVKTLDDVSIVPVDVATEQAVLMLKAGFIEAKKRRERNAQAKRDYDQELREADDATKTLRDDYARCGGLAYRYERLVDTYREYVKLAGGDKHIARGFLRKAYAEVDIREAFAWCEVEDPGERGHAYLVPYRNGKTGKYEAQLIVGYRGLIALARRSTDIQSVEAHVVYERDTFTVEYGINPKLVHVPTLSSDRGQIVAVYCVAAFKDGARHAELMTIAEVESIRMRSRARDNGPWKTDYAEMCRKTVVRRAAKYWPLSTEFVRALEHEDDVETGDRTELPALSSDVDVAGELAAGNDDLGDGEVVAPAAEPSKTSRLAEQIRAQKGAPAASEPTGDEPPPPADDEPPFPEEAARAQAEAARKGETKTREQREAEFKAKHKGAREPGSEG